MAGDCARLPDAYRCDSSPNCSFVERSPLAPLASRCRYDVWKARPEETAKATVPAADPSRERKARDLALAVKTFREEAPSKYKRFLVTTHEDPEGAAAAMVRECQASGMDRYAREGAGFPQQICRLSAQNRSRAQPTWQALGSAHLGKRSPGARWPLLYLLAATSARYLGHSAASPTNAQRWAAHHPEAYAPFWQKAKNEVTWLDWAQELDLDAPRGAAQLYYANELAYADATEKDPVLKWAGLVERHLEEAAIAAALGIDTATWGVCLLGLAAFSEALRDAKTYYDLRAFSGALVEDFLRTAVGKVLVPDFRRMLLPWISGVHSITSAGSLVATCFACLPSDLRPAVQHAIEAAKGAPLLLLDNFKKLAIQQVKDKSRSQGDDLAWILFFVACWSATGLRLRPLEVVGLLAPAVARGLLAHPKASRGPAAQNATEEADEALKLSLRIAADCNQLAESTTRRVLLCAETWARKMREVTQKVKRDLDAVKAEAAASSA